jgi:hypothetical protein
MENNYFYSTPTQGSTETYLYKVDKTTDKIIKNENRDRYVAARMIYDSVKEGVSNISITETDLYCPFDLTMNCDVPVLEHNTTANCQIVIEIKERYKNEEQLKKYPNIELKVSKYERIKRASKGRAIYYFVLLNETTGYIIDITDIDKLKGIEKFNWKIKRTQLDDNSDYVIEPTYSIPVENAKKTINISQYYKDYYDSNLIEDANTIQTKEKN